MERIKIICPHCGLEKEIFSNEYEKNYNCPICSNDMELKEQSDKIKENIEIVDNYLVEDMRNQINILGNDKAWYIIEDLPIPQTRITYRNLFFKAGGKVPESKIL